ncbi:hypothetical protein BJ997_000644 [Cryobacterium roopkundense]|uniref:Uncharacterized protein n=1 Tax=Cryobacterium roopkundense TaxID=1001240 RepID=A0A7W8ZTU9_9MICO|nr:hypothetical protein [Cryobacterium roopkundense]
MNVRIPRNPGILRYWWTEIACTQGIQLKETNDGSVFPVNGDYFGSPDSSVG